MLIKLDSLGFSSLRGELIVRDGTSYIFSKTKHLLQHIDERKAHFEKVHKMALVVAPLYRETLKSEQIIKVFEIVAEEHGKTLMEILQRTKEEEIVRIRWIAMKICNDRGLSYAQIGKEINLNRGTIKYGVESLDFLISNNSKISVDFIETTDAVLYKLNGRFKEDGSGDKYKKDERTKAN